METSEFRSISDSNMTMYTLFNLSLVWKWDNQSYHHIPCPLDDEPNKYGKMYSMSKDTRQRHEPRQRDAQRGEELGCMKLGKFHSHSHQDHKEH